MSGGEQEDLILLFTLAFAKLYNFPFLMLDESTSLDQKYTSIVVNTIKKHFPKKLQHYFINIFKVTTGELPQYCTIIIK